MVLSELVTACLFAATPTSLASAAASLMGVGLAPPTRRAGSKRCRNDRLRETGYRFLYPTYREGYGSLF